VKGDGFAKSLAQRAQRSKEELLKKQVFSALPCLCVGRDLCARLLSWCGCGFDALP
jgi:hypothetical protein